MVLFVMLNVVAAADEFDGNDSDSHNNFCADKNDATFSDDEDIDDGDTREVGDAGDSGDDDDDDDETDDDETDDDE